MARQHLVESFSVSLKEIERISLTESTQVVEKNGKKFKCRAAYKFPTWRLDTENLNKRVYSTSLAEQVIKDNKITLGFCNHPKDDEEGNVADTFAVERNPRIEKVEDKNIFYVDAYLVGEKGELANEILEAGGYIGLSSSAYGDVDKDGMVQLSGFSVERYADWVENPSYEVFVKKEDDINTNKSPEIEEDSDKTIINEIKNKNKLSEENDTNINMKQIENKKGEDIVMKKTLSVEEKNLKMGIKNLLEKAESRESLKEKMETYEEVLEYCEGIESDFAKASIEKASEKITEIRNELHELANKAREVDSLKESKEKVEKDRESLQEDIEIIKKEKEELQKNLDEMTEKFDKATELLDSMKLGGKKVKDMYDLAIAEKNGMVKASEYTELFKYTEVIEKELKDAKRKIAFLTKKPKVEEDSNGKKIREIKENSEIKAPDKKLESSVGKGLFVKHEIDRKNESEFDFRNDTEVERYYEDLLAGNPDVEKIKENILSCKTLLEAQKAYLDSKDIIENIPDPELLKFREEKDRLEENLRENSPSSVVGQALKLRKGWE